MTSIIVHYQELALKGRNRPWFVERLVRNLREACVGLGVREVRPLAGRIEMVAGDGPVDFDRIAARVRQIFGVANFALAERVAPDVAAIEASVLRRVRGLPAASFNVRCARADKRFPMTSPDLERLLGRRIQVELGWPVNLSEPVHRVRVEILPGQAFCYVGKEPGAGGLPTGVSGRVACLLSGGIDSPVAAWRLMRRGCRALFVHFHSYPIVSMTSQEKARRIVGRLTEFQLHSRLFLVPFGTLQQRLVVEVPPPLRVVLYRRFMFRIAEQIARRAGARAIVTGEVVGQVASQTLENLTIIDGAAGMPVLRPLVGFDKEEITAEARRIGTYETSIVPDEDCCQVFTPRHPATRARVEHVEAVEAGLAVEELVHAALEGTVREEFTWPNLGNPVVLPVEPAAQVPGQAASLTSG
jgi:thiamine biosynthesis protein ThiI